MYQGELIDEALFKAMLRQFPDAAHQYETETKARIRRAMAALGISSIEQHASIETGHAVVTALQGKDWLGAMPVLSKGITPYVECYREIAENAPAEHRKIATSMVEHE